jgi:hypothetical protein
LRGKQASEELVRPVVVVRVVLAHHDSNRAAHRAEVAQGNGEFQAGGHGCGIHRRGERRLAQPVELLGTGPATETNVYATSAFWSAILARFLGRLLVPVVGDHQQKGL